MSTDAEPGKVGGDSAHAPAGSAAKAGSSYGEILRSSAWMGGSTALNIAAGIVRTKSMAVLLGPAGFGLLGLYGAVADMARSLSQLGINSSAVRQIAEAGASGQPERVAITIAAVRRITVALGLVGAAVLAAFSTQVSMLTFGNALHATAIALLAVAVFLRLVADGQSAVLQGMRRIGDIARLSVLGGIAGTLISIALVYWLREDGVVPSLIAVAGVSLLASWHYSRRVAPHTPPLSPRELGREAKALLTLGFAFLASSCLMMGASYAVRILVLRHDGLEAAGLYQAAWTLGGMYIGFILQAMATDFYPRLVAAAQDHPRCNRLANEQAQVSLLLAGPGVVATLTFAPLVLVALYSQAFAPAAETLRWICLGMALRVVTWPMGFIIVAKGAQALFFATELAWAIGNLTLTAWAVDRYGLRGAGIAFFGSYVLHGLIVYPVARHLTGFRWSTANTKTIAVFLLLTAGVFIGFQYLPPLAAAGLGTAAFVASCLYSLRALVGLTSSQWVPPAVLRLLARLKPGPAPAAR